MTLNTQTFGEIQINQDDILNFPEGIPGFWEEKDFVLLHTSEEGSEQEDAICFLQSTKNHDLSFVLIDVSGFLGDYRPLALLEYAKTAEEFDQNNLLVYNILTVQDELSDSTANLKAPIIIDINKKTGFQVLCQDSDFPIRARLFDIVNQEGGDCQC